MPLLQEDEEGHVWGCKPKERTEVTGTSSVSADPHHTSSAQTGNEGQQAVDVEVQWSLVSLQ